MKELAAYAKPQESKIKYQYLGQSGLKVSQIILGAMSYGSSKWQDWVLDEEQALPLLKHAYDSGITAWDTADVYSNGRSEEIIGAAITKYNIPRSRLVLLSKCYFGVTDDDNSVHQPKIPEMMNNDGDLVNRVGLSRKHIFDAVEASVKRLGTYIDVLQIHRLDRGAPKKEIMRALNDVVEKGWVRYIGASSMAAWEFQELQNIAETHNWHKFISMQNYHNLLYREEEREMIPYCKHTGVGLIPWSPMARGVLARPWSSRSTTREASDNTLKALIRGKENETDEKIVNKVEEIAKRKGISMAAVAVGWSIAKGDIPILGLSSKERIDEAVENSKTVLSEEEIAELDGLYMPKAVSGY
ncbi:Aldo/keto reductase, partial [Aureobasidium melanogenum]|uniref:Aldo/keto reductase n=1 Tax=Aureobasidium melanogenum (strain CBS 110374) TaxID=1043003 RepID=A0A074WJW7_AURM1